MNRNNKALKYGIALVIITSIGIALFGQDLSFSERLLTILFSFGILIAGEPAED